MKAISIWQPWASLIMLGAKTFETRSWSYPKWLDGELILIHAAKKRLTIYDQRDVLPLVNKVLEEQGQDPLDYSSLPFGCLLGTVKLAGCFPTDSRAWTNGLTIKNIRHEEALGNWGANRKAWRSSDRRQFKISIPFRGGQGFFNVSDFMLEGREFI